MNAEAPPAEQATSPLLGRILKPVEPAKNKRLLTVVFSSVCFFGGIARALNSRAVRLTLSVVAVLLFATTFLELLTSPIRHK